MAAWGDGLDAGIVSNLIARWQSLADESGFEELVAAVRPIIEDVAGRVLRSSRIADPSAVDDSVAMVLDHLRRLPCSNAGDRRVAAFRLTGTDSGIAFVRWLAKERARDVARARRRQSRLAVTFSQLGRSECAMLGRVPVGAEPDRGLLERMHRAIADLDARGREVLARLLDGESQAAIAKDLGVCEGTVSRIRTKAIEEIRRAVSPEQPRPR